MNLQANQIGHFIHCYSENPKAKASLKVFKRYSNPRQLEHFCYSIAKAMSQKFFERGLRAKTAGLLNGWQEAKVEAA